MGTADGGPRAPGEGLARAFRRAAAAADRVDARFAARSPRALSPGHPGVIPATWASARLVVSGVLLPVLGAIVGTAAIRNTRRTIRLIERYPELVAAAAAGRPVPYPAARVERVPAGGRYFISSDLHRCVPGTVDWPGHQHAAPLYELALDHYAAGEWGLVENGDVEDFWMVGGSTYGVVYDVFRLVGHAWRGRVGEALLRAIYREHLRRIVAHNDGVYARIEQGFHAHGRYRRVVGNHDDVFLDPDLVDALAEVHPGVTVADFLVLDTEALDPADADPAPGTTVDRAADRRRAIGVATHGHHVDSWNAPFRSGLGKLGTWFGAMLLDAPFGANPGMPEAEETEVLLSGRLRAALTKVSPVFGANAELYSVDETLLFDAFRRFAGVPRGTDLDEGLWLLLGHTHLPLRHPVDPDTHATWTRYVNSGAGVFWECVTGIEWDGTTDPEHPEVRLVAWRYADHDAATPEGHIVGWAGERAVVREVLDRVAPNDTLEVVDGGAGDLGVVTAPAPAPGARRPGS